MTALAEITKQLLHAAKEAGAADADAIAVSGDSLQIGVRNGALEEAERSEGVDIGLRVLLGRRQACVSASDTRPETITAMAERAVAMAKEAPEDPTCGLADPDQLAEIRDNDALDLVDDSEPPSPELLKERALEAEAASLAVEGVTRTDSAGAGYEDVSIHLAMTNGFEGRIRRTSHAVQAVAIAGNGLEMENDYAFETRTHFADLPPVAETGRLAGERAVARYGATRPPTGAYPVIFDERIAAGLIGHLVQAINGQAIARGASWLKDALGEQVLPKGMDLIEDPSRHRVRGSRMFDAEGLPCAKRALVRDGVLQGWTLDLATARKLGLESTANASRGTGSTPSPAVTHLGLTEGAMSRDELLAQMGTGLLVTSMIGSTINPNTGDYSRGAAGFWVENGEIKRPVNECTVAGNLREMLLSITAANDARHHMSRVVPSLLVEGMVIAGS
ncbi:TldD/PmbA family protein [Amaricoccus tamworthensis]|uniref:TldD/PmbA family protein n=1 Tax=Amaricoccus tamworthensis TaxID=57002 RepID=UPI003C7E5B65